MVFLIAIDFADNTRDLSKLEKELKSTGTWWHHISNIWIIESSESANEVYDRIARYLTKADTILVTQITNEQQGWLSKSAWKWLNNLDY